MTLLMAMAILVVAAVIETAVREKEEVSEVEISDYTLSETYGIVNRYMMDHFYRILIEIKRASSREELINAGVEVERFKLTHGYNRLFSDLNLEYFYRVSSL